MSDCPTTPTTAEPPMQPVYRAGDGVIRFQPNAIVRYLLDAGPFDMNHLAMIPFSDADRRQFAQLIGYSVSGYGDLSYASEDSVDLADQAAQHILDGEPVSNG